MHKKKRTPPPRTLVIGSCDLPASAKPVPDHCG
jgi:hypothetical protein